MEFKFQQFYKFKIEKYKNFDKDKGKAICTQRSNGAKIIASEKGVALILILAVLPLLISISLFLISAYQVLLWDNKSHHLCRNQILGDQEQIKVAYKKLMRLNLGAASLRSKYNIALIQLAIATASNNPGAISKASLRLYKVMQRQRKYRLKQDKALAQIHRVIKTLNLTSPRSLAYKLKRHFSAGQSSYLRYKKMRYTYNLEPRPRSSTTPNFEAVINFTSHQSTQFSWEIPVSKILLPQALRNLKLLDGFFKNNPIKGACSASIYNEEGLTWFSGLTAAKL